jgi:hypothetical protein
LVKWKLKVCFNKWHKPFKIVERIFRNKKNKKFSMNLWVLFRLLYWDSYHRSIHQKQLLEIENVIKSINKKVKLINNWKRLLSFKGQILEEL